MATIPNANQSDCCPKSCDDPIVVNIPGAKGDKGDAGTNGTNGINAYSNLLAGFTMPVSLANVTVNLDSAWMAVGQIVFVQSAGYMQVVSKADATHAVLKNLSDYTTAYPNNAVAGAAIAISSLTTSAGIQGPNGSLTGTASGQLKGTYPGPNLAVGTTKGDLIAHTSASGGTAARLAVGADGTRVMADSASALGMKYAKVDLSSTAETTGTLPVLQGGTGATTTAAARTALGLGTMAVQNATAVAVTGGTIVGITDLAVADGGTGASTAAAARTNLGVLAGYGIIGVALGVDMNVATNDNAMTMLSSRYRIDKLTVDNASISLTAATAGLFTAAGGGGTTLAADQVLSALTASSKFKDLTLQAIVGTDVGTAGTLYFRTGTAQGSAATGDVRIFGWKYD